MADAFVVALDAQAFQNLLAEFAFEFLAGAVDPDAANAQACGGVHQVAHYEASSSSSLTMSGLNLRQLRRFVCRILMKLGY